jgi:hypothetical protein
MPEQPTASTCFEQKLAIIKFLFIYLRGNGISVDDEMRLNLAFMSIDELKRMCKELGLVVAQP